MGSVFMSRLKQITWKHWLVSLLMSQAIFISMQIVTIPLILQEAGGLKIFDMLPLGYTYDYAYQFLAQLTERGYELYKYVQLPLDIFFPILNCLAGLCTFILLTRLYLRVSRKSLQDQYSLALKIVLALPLIAMLFDYLENLMIFVMLTYRLAIPKALVGVANIFTIVKSMSTTMFYTINLLLGIVAVIIWLKKIKEAKSQWKASV